MDKRIKAFVLDLDGVVYRGSELIEGAEKRVAELKKRGQVLFLTNNSLLSRSGYADKLQSMGVPADEKEVITSAYAAALYIKKRRSNARVFPIGEEGLLQELAQQRIEICNTDCDIVLVGLDRNFNYEKLAKAMEFITNGAAFIATTTNKTLITERGLVPGTGAIVSAIEAATQKEPLVVGKPSKIMGEVLLKKLRAKPKEALIIGDRLESDIAFGKSLGMKTALVLTGAAKAEDLKKSKIKPDYVLEKL